MQSRISYIRTQKFVRTAEEKYSCDVWPSSQFDVWSSYQFDVWPSYQFDVWPSYQFSSHEPQLSGGISVLELTPHKKMNSQ